MVGIILLGAVTVLYAGYNLFIKMSGVHVPATATTTILATICIQLAALVTSLFFLGYVTVKGGQILSLSNNAYLWAALAGICIGGAEIGYLYLFGGVGLSRPMDASVAIPTIVSGTIVLSMLFAYFVLKEAVTWNQLLGSLLIVSGIMLFFIRLPTQG